MTNAPFRIAFWTMCCAFLLSVALIASSLESRQLLTAITSQLLRSPASGPLLPQVVLGPEQDLRFPAAAAITNPIGNSVGDGFTLSSSEPAVAACAQAEQSEAIWPSEYSLPAADGIRTASANPNLPLGTTVTELQSHLTIKPGLQNADMEPVTTPSIAVRPGGEEEVALSQTVAIPVPQPEVWAAAASSSETSQTHGPDPAVQVETLHSGITDLRLARLQRELIAARISESEKLHALTDAELEGIEERLHQVRDVISPPRAALDADPVVVAQADPDTAYGVPPAELVTAEPVPAPYADPAERVQISGAAEADRFDVIIDNADLGDALQALGKQIGWRVTITPGVSGAISGEFFGADIEQVFAMLLKANQLRNDRRGDYILISPRP